ncbi:MAG: zinc ribbon domain-containing protein [Deltaproteobacteria bacterium]|nr:zinc ribbon domain-containing protein [Deltaproteobacteria bacterium]
MKCSKCRFENRENAKFCKECGNKLELACPQCGNAYAPGTKFCDECGHSLAQPPEPAPESLSFDEKLDKIQRYLPKGLTEKILSQRGKIEGERKQVTVMFCEWNNSAPKRHTTSWTGFTRFSFTRCMTTRARSTR